MFNIDIVDDMDRVLIEAFNHAAGAILPRQVFEKRRPWISSLILELLRQRDVARRTGDHYLERDLSKQTKRQVKRDREQWLDEGLARRDWKMLKALRKSNSKSSSTLLDDSGMTLPPEERA